MFFERVKKYRPYEIIITIILFILCALCITVASGVVEPKGNYSFDDIVNGNVIL